MFLFLNLKVPADLSYQYRYHLMIHGLSGLYFEEDARLQYNSGYRQETFGVLIQTDKAVYKPGQTGKILKCLGYHLMIHGLSGLRGGR